MPELKRNILNFRYSNNFKYEGMLLHSFDRFCVETRVVLPMVEDLKLPTIQFDSTCKHLNSGIGQANCPGNCIQNLKAYCKKIVPSGDFYKKQIEHYNCTAYEILMKKMS